MRIGYDCLGSSSKALAKRERSNARSSATKRLARHGRKRFVAYRAYRSKSAFATHSFELNASSTRDGDPHHCKKLKPTLELLTQAVLTGEPDLPGARDPSGNIPSSSASALELPRGDANNFVVPDIRFFAATSASRRIVSCTRLVRLLRALSPVRALLAVRSATPSAAF